MNESDFHRPIIMIRSGGCFAMNKAMAAPDRRDLLPMSSGPNPKQEPPPVSKQAELRSDSVKALLMSVILRQSSV